MGVGPIGGLGAVLDGEQGADDRVAAVEVLSVGVGGDLRRVGLQNA